MTATDLAEIGEALFGPQWQSPLARALNVNLRTVQRWAAGSHPIPPSVPGPLVTMLEAKGITINELLARIRLGYSTAP